MLGAYYLDILKNVYVQTPYNDPHCFEPHRPVITALGFTGRLKVQRECIYYR
jgi:hypothetical protein